MVRPTERPRRGQARPPDSPFLPPPPRPQLPPAEPTLQQRGVAALALGILSLLAILLGGFTPRGGTVAAVALAVAVGALALGISATSAAKRTRTRRPRGAVVGVVLGVIGLLSSGTVLVGFLTLRPQLDQYFNCLNSATTATAQQACQTQFDNAIRHKYGLPADS